jgi:hypothetical protein
MQSRRDVGPALREGVKTRAQYDVLRDTSIDLFDDEVFYESGAGHDGCPIGTRPAAIHIRALTPLVLGVDQT